MTEPNDDIQTIPFVEWNDFMSLFKWKQGEHVGIIGPTGQGKTTLSMHLLPLRRFVVVFATKPKDKSMSRLKKRGYKFVKEWKPLSPTMYPRRVLWPKATDLDSTPRQQTAFDHAFKSIYVEGGWTLFLDEVWYMTNILKFNMAIKTYLLQARALKISLVLAAQRPKWIPLEVFDQSTHLFFFKDNDAENLARISSIGSINAIAIRNAVAHLHQYEALYVNSRSNEMFRTMAPNPDEKSEKGVK